MLEFGCYRTVLFDVLYVLLLPSVACLIIPGCSREPDTPLEKLTRNAESGKLTIISEAALDDAIALIGKEDNVAQLLQLTVHLGRMKSDDSKIVKNDGTVRIVRIELWQTCLGRIKSLGSAEAANALVSLLDEDYDAGMAVDLDYVITAMGAPVLKPLRTYEGANAGRAESLALAIERGEVWAQ